MKNNLKRHIAILLVIILICASFIVFEMPKEVHAHERYDFHIIFHMYDGSDDYVAVGVWPGDTLDLAALETLGIPMDHIFGEWGTPGRALWGWFDAETLATGIGRADLDAHGKRNGFRRPAVGAQSFDFSAVLTNCMFDSEGNLHLYVIWSLWGDANDDGQVTGFDATLINQYLFDRWLVSSGSEPQFNAAINKTAANVSVSGQLSGFDATLINQYLFDRWTEAVGTPTFFIVLGQQPSDQSQPLFEEIFRSHSYCLWWLIDNYYSMSPKIFVFRSRADIDSLLQERGQYMTSEQIERINDMFDEAFFHSDFLLLLAHTESHGGRFTEVNRVYTDADVLVVEVLTSYPPQCLGDLATVIVPYYSFIRASWILNQENVHINHLREWRECDGCYLCK